METKVTEQLKVATEQLSEQQQHIGDLATLPARLEEIVGRDELSELHALVLKEQTVIEAANSKNEELELQLEQVQRDTEGAADRALEELQEISKRCKEVVRDASSWRQLIEMRVHPLEEADRRFRPMLEGMSSQ